MRALLPDSPPRRHNTARGPAFATEVPCSFFEPRHPARRAHRRPRWRAADADPSGRCRWEGRTAARRQTACRCYLTTPCRSRQGQAGGSAVVRAPPRHRARNRRSRSA
eukprot:364287-Chlamydomonas_euryale.AAC.10